MGDKVKNEKSKTVKKKLNSKVQATHLNERKSSVKTKEKLLIKDNDKKIVIKKIFTKVNITYFILFLLDISLVIYSAKKNIVNYIVVSDYEIFVSKTRYLLLGRNYINLVIIGFFYVYICLINRFFLHRKNTKKFLGWLFVVLTVLNCLLFFIFTRRVY